MQMFLASLDELLIEIGANTCVTHYKSVSNIQIHPPMQKNQYTLCKAFCRNAHRTRNES